MNRVDGKNKSSDTNRHTVRKWGNSAGVRIPMNAMRAAKLKIDQEVKIYEDHGKIIVEPVKKRRVMLKDLLCEITPDNLHDAVDTGFVAGKEVW